MDSCSLVLSSLDIPILIASKGALCIQTGQKREKTLDRKIRKGEIEAVREGRRVYVRMHGPEYPSDDELLRRAIMREGEFERTVRQLDRSAPELDRSGTRPGTPLPPAKMRTNRWGRRIARSAPRTRGQNDWLSGSAS